MSTLLDLAPIASMLFFFAIFMWIAFRTFRPSVKQALQHYATIPLNEDHHGE